jgi:hypothetical protein
LDFRGDGVTQGGIYGTTSGSSGYLSFSTNNAGSTAERLRITAAGLVGIGGTPSKTLHVLKSNEYAARIGGASYYWDMGQKTTDSSPSLDAIGTSASAIFRTNGTEHMRITDTGLVGIGTAVPNFPVNIYGASTDLAGLVLRNTNATVGDKLKIGFDAAWQSATEYGSYVGVEAMNVSGGSRAEDMIFGVRNQSEDASDPIERLRITAAGRVTVKKSSNSEIVDQASGTCDLSASNNYQVTIGGATTINLTSGTDGQSGVIKIVHNGSNVPTFTSSQIKWEGGTVPTPSTGSGDIDLIAYYVDEHIYGVYLNGMA